MTQEEIDKAIAEAMADSKKQSKWHRPERKFMSPERIAQTRRALNMIFMLGAVACLIVYFAFPDNKALFFSIGFGAIILKIVEFVLRFMF